MILVVEAIGSSLEASSPARYSPLSRSVKTQVRAATTGSSTSLACWADAGPAWTKTPSASATTSVEARPAVRVVGGLYTGYRGYDDSAPATRAPVAATILLSCFLRLWIREPRETSGHRLLRGAGDGVGLPFLRQRRDGHGLAHAAPAGPERG